MWASHPLPPAVRARLNPKCYYNGEMSKSSVVTVRETPLASTASASAGGFAVIAESMAVDTTERLEILDLTEAVMSFVRRSGVKEGLLSLWSMHTTCCIFINESQAALDVDMKAYLETTVPRDHYYRHNDPDHSDCDRRNADSHLRAMLLGHSVTMQISGGEVVLGQWQRVLCGEMDGPRTRTIRAQVQGIVVGS